eukprot:XP_001697405.1 predicted protein [Chlamydomonas reinhardtii]
MRATASRAGRATSQASLLLHATRPPMVRRGRAPCCPPSSVTVGRDGDGDGWTDRGDPDCCWRCGNRWWLDPDEQCKGVCCDGNVANGDGDSDSFSCFLSGSSRTRAS